jgi:hypothetical protein
MRRRKQSLTLGDLIRIVSQFSHNDQELSLAVADLMNRGVVRSRGRHKNFRVVAAGH